MKLQFDPNQQFQLDALAAVADLFDGQPKGAPEYAVIAGDARASTPTGQEQTELGVGNRMLLAETEMTANTRGVQERNDIDVADPSAPLEAWKIFDAPANVSRHCPHFSVEMETGTGKTYLYLRTIFELSKRYGFQKYIIVVPSIAIREGVLKNIQITADHFRALYPNQPLEHFVYDARTIYRVRQFAASNRLQIMVINIDAFRKNFVGTGEDQKSNVIYKETDRLSGRQPIEFIQTARPIVIIDEPQSVDSTEKAQDAIKALNPLCTLRYSATHRNPYNLVYRLDPVTAFRQKLVKQIVVASAIAEGDTNAAFVRVEEIGYRKGIKARILIDVRTQRGPQRKSVVVTSGTNLFLSSNQRACYEHGFSVAEISAEPSNEFIRFENGRVLRQGEEMGGMLTDVWRAQIRHTVRKHLEKELQTKKHGIKVLSLFFIDRVANYRDYDEAGNPLRGKFAKALEAELAAFAKEQRYRSLRWMKLPSYKLHNGYFARDRKGILKDTRGDTQADDDAYNLIMKDKERLLSLEEPLRFVFSHSALREGWDNPNVFQICTLNETQSVIKKRQEIGRGLRLPVDQKGLRVFDESINKLYIMANETYDAFARSLQTEYEEDCGVTFGRVPLAALARLTWVVNGEEQAIGQDAAEAIWSALVKQGLLDAKGYIQPDFDPKRNDFRLELPETYADLAPAIVDLLGDYQMERHIQRDCDEKVNRLRKEIQLGSEFKALWSRIKPKTTFRVEFETDKLVKRGVEAVRVMATIKPPTIKITAGQVYVTKGGVRTKAVSATEERVRYEGPLPDILTYLQNETELTRSTLVRIINGSGRLGDFVVNPQDFMDSVAAVVKQELHRMLVDGIKYERVRGHGPDSEWEMVLFKNEELINYLSAQKVKKSVYEYIVYESEVEREFARRLDQREDIKLFVKLPAWFEIDTPVGKYNPDWAILKHDGQALYLVRETKSTKDFMKLRGSEVDKVRCGARHFDAIGVPFAVVVKADEV